MLCWLLAKGTNPLSYLLSTGLGVAGRGQRLRWQTQGLGKPTTAPPRPALIYLPLFYFLNRECEIDDDIIAFLLFDQNFSPIQNLFVTLKFAHTALLDDEETHCMSWDL